MELNAHGIEGRWLDSGRFGRMDESGHFRSHLPVFVPKCCLGCRWYDYGETGEYGERLTPPYCERNVWFPTKTGTCKKQVLLRAKGE